MIPPLFAIFAWPVVAATLFARLHKPLAVLVTILAGFLLLPERTLIDLPLLPTLDKATIPALAALAFSSLMASQPGGGTARPGLLPGSGVGRLLLAILVAGAFATVMTNADPLFYGPRVITGLRPYDAFSAVLSLMMLLLPALLARKYLGDPDGHRLILKALCIAMLGYSLLVLVEIRLSPQMSRWIYGVSPLSWIQNVRDGGYRPFVFVGHGLTLAMVLCMAILAAAGLSRIDGPRRMLWLLAASWLLLTLLLSNSLGAVVLVVAIIPVVMFLSVRVQMMVVAAVAVIFLTYPILRGANLIPLDAIVSAAARVSDERAGSLQYRIDNEEILLAKANDRPVFGWGAWGRSRVYDEETGRDVSVTDGYWVIVIGTDGWVGYIGKSGLLALPIFLLLWRSRQLEVGRETAVLMLVLAANLIDLLPNSSLMPLTWIIAGALWGRLEHMPEAAADTARDGSAAGPPTRVGYARPHAAAPRPVPRPSEPVGPATAYTRQSTRIVRSARR